MTTLRHHASRGEPGPWLFTSDGLPPFDALIVSPDVDAPPHNTTEVEVQLARDGRWGEWLSLGDFVRGSRGDHAGPAGEQVLTDLVRVGPPCDGVAVRLRPDGRARSARVVFATWMRGRPDLTAPVPAGLIARGPHSAAAWGRVLDVPERSQMPVEPAALAPRVCSPTSVSMILAWHAVDVAPADLAALVHDRTADLYGNWPFNTATAARLMREHRSRGGAVPAGRGFETAYVARMESLAEAEAGIAAGRPMVISHRWEAGDLPGAPLPRSAGHLVVLCGFTPDGDPVINDPAADPRKGESVRRTYPRAALARTWLQRADGVCYLFAAGGD